ncbi:MAG: hypothetical protein HYZ68_04870 [Chloroflexi bacterium]|nr:hypothetical protein [Chloroflexota bacterium]
MKLELLTTPIHLLGLPIKGTFLEVAIRRVRGDMRRAGIQIEPFFYLSDGYGTIERTTNIGLGFYDCHPLLQELNEEYRGWRHSEADILHLVRHEVGHAFGYAYKLYRTPEFRRVFKVRRDFLRSYPPADRYHPNPWSRDFVNPSRDHYAQKHPDDDFAETFAVWLKPRQDWRRRYRSKPGALTKLEYVEWAVRSYRREPPAIKNDPTKIVAPVEELTTTVAQLFRVRPTKYRRKATGYIDPDLRELFWPAAPRNHRSGYRPASRFLRQHRQALVAQVSHWVGVEPVVVGDLVSKCISRADVLQLQVPKDQEMRVLVAVVSYLTTLCANYAARGKYLLDT